MAKPHLVEFMNPAICGFFGTIETLCGSENAPLGIHQGDQPVALGEPYRQLTIMQLCVQQLFFAATKAA